jgi:hypothetical protein
MEPRFCVGTCIKQFIATGFYVVLNRAAARLLRPGNENEALKGYTEMGVTIANDSDQIRSWMR